MKCCPMCGWSMDGHRPQQRICNWCWAVGVNSIRSDYITQAELAEMFGVTHSTVFNKLHLTLNDVSYERKKERDIRYSRRRRRYDPLYREQGKELSKQWRLDNKEWTIEYRKRRKQRSIPVSSEAV